MRELDATSATFAAQLEQLLAWDLGVDSDIDIAVAQIIKQVRSAGDEQLLALTRTFDNGPTSLAARLRDLVYGEVEAHSSASGPSSLRARARAVVSL